MKILLNENQFRLIKESINPSEVTDNIMSVSTLCNGERGVAWVTGISYKEGEIIGNMIIDCDLDSIKVPSNPHDAYIVFDLDHKHDAFKLLKIAEKYGGFLKYNALEEDVREIGRILNYNQESIDDFIQKRD